MGFETSREYETVREELLKDPELRKKMGANARRCAEERFDRKTTYQKLVRSMTAQ